MKSLPRDWEQNSDTSSAVLETVPERISGFSRDGGGSGCNKLGELEYYYM